LRASPSADFIAETLLKVSYETKKDVLICRSTGNLHNDSDQYLIYPRSVDVPEGRRRWEGFRKESRTQGYVNAGSHSGLGASLLTFRVLSTRSVIPRVLGQSSGDDEILLHTRSGYQRADSLSMASW